MYRYVNVRKLDRKSFQPYGEIIEPTPEMRRAAEPRNSFKSWDDLVDPRTENFVFGYLEAYASSLEFDTMERHVNTAEVIIPLTGCSVLPLAPPKELDNPDAKPQVEDIVGFLLDGTTAVCLYRGTWHHPPISLSSVSTFLIGIKKGTVKNDLHIVDFEKEGIKLKIRL